MKLTTEVDRTVVFSLKQGFSSNFQNKGKSVWIGSPTDLRPSIINLMPCDHSDLEREANK